MQKRGLFAAIVLTGSINLIACGGSKSSQGNDGGAQGGQDGKTLQPNDAGSSADARLGSDGAAIPGTDASTAGRADAGIVVDTGGAAIAGNTGILSSTGGRGSGGVATGGVGGASAGATAGTSGDSGGTTTGTTTKTPDAAVADAAGPDVSDAAADAAADASLAADVADSGPDTGSATNDGGTQPISCAPAVTRGGKFFNFTERFNRYYTDCGWQPSKTVYVSPTGTGNGTSRSDAADVSSALAAAQPGQMIVFTAGTYAGCYELDSDHSGTYDNPIVLTGERKADGSIGATVNCCSSGRRTCFNLEAADYVAVEGFEMVGGNYGVRSVGADYAADQHQKGVSVLRSIAHGQNGDPYFTGQSDWFVIEGCTGYDTGSGDGHAIYLSNGGDWNIARWNETYNTFSSDFQINADPESTCDGIAVDSPECDAVAGTHTTGGRGASDYMLIDSNFFHHSKAQGPNFTSVRNSTIKNNIFAMSAKHGTSFWQETTNPKLGSSNNQVLHNLFITELSDRQAIGVTNSSTGNQFKNNVVVSLSISGTTISANASAPLLTTDSSTVAANTFEHNAWISGYFDSDDAAAPYVPNSTELRLTSFDAAWFAAFPTTVGHDPGAFAPTASAPWLDKGNLLPDAPTDRAGTARKAPVDLGPYEK
jgi:hypothetical protein